MPVILKNASSLFGHRLRQWRSREYLKREFGQTQHTASVFQHVESGAIEPMPQHEGGIMRLAYPEKRRVTLEKALENRGADGEAFCLEQSRIFEAKQAPHPLWRDVALSPLLGGLNLELANVWLSTAQRKETRLHFDAKENLLLQLVGRKSFTLFSAANTLRMYPRPMAFDRQHSESAHGDDEEDLVVTNFSPVEPKGPDTTRYPLFGGARPMHCELGAGDALYLPPFTWHRVSSYRDSTSELNVALNFWFTTAKAGLRAEV